MGGNYEYPVMEEQERRQDHWDYGLLYTRGDSYYGRERNGVEEMPLIRNGVENRGPCRTDVARKVDADCLYIMINPEKLRDTIFISQLCL